MGIWPVLSGELAFLTHPRVMSNEGSGDRGAGFIGSHVVDRYLEEGHEVVVIDNLSTGRLEYLNRGAKFYQLGINSSQVEKVFATERPEVLNHHAAQMDVRRSVEDPIYDAQVNVLGTLNLLQNCVKYGVKKVIFASTGGAIYGEQDYFPADEEHPTRPISPYGVTKLAGEKYLHFYQETYGMDCIILRYTNVYGPRQNPYGEAGVVAIFTERLLTGKEAIINGDGRQTRDYVFIGDVVVANSLALQNQSSGVFNIGTGIETDVNEIFHRLNRLTGAGAPEVHGPPKAGEQRRSVVDYSRAREVLGWKPRVDLEEGLRITVEYFQEVLTQSPSGWEG